MQLAEYSLQDKIAHYNSTAGIAQRTNSTLKHRKFKAKGQHVCCTRFCKHSKVHWYCGDCPGLYFCNDLHKNPVVHPDHDHNVAQGLEVYYTCFEMFHDGRFIIPS